MELDLEKRRISLIDADSIIYVCHWDAMSKSWDKPLTEICNSVDKVISKILIETKATHYLGFYGAGKSFRFNYYPDYKGNRKKLEPLPYIGRIKEYMNEIWEFIPTNHLEADDCVNICKNNLQNSTICAIDKDLLSLEGTHFNYKKFEWVTTTKDEAYVQFWKDMLIGQPGDNIKGIPKKGEKAADLILESTTETSDDSLFRSLVFENYISYFGEEEGINEFYKNYKCLKILDKSDSFTIPNPVKVKTEQLVI
jgi:protein Xni